MRYSADFGGAVDSAYFREDIGYTRVTYKALKSKGRWIDIGIETELLVDYKAGVYYLLGGARMVYDIGVYYNGVALAYRKSSAVKKHGSVPFVTELYLYILMPVCLVAVYLAVARELWRKYKRELVRKAYVFLISVF